LATLPSSRRSRASSTSSGRHPAPPPIGLPQPQAQPLEAPKIIVIHPGSQHLRIGRAADLNPLTLLHAVAYRRRPGASDRPHHDPLLPPLDNVNSNSGLMVEFEEQRLLGYLVPLIGIHLQKIKLFFIRSCIRCKGAYLNQA